MRPALLDKHHCCLHVCTHVLLKCQQLVDTEITNLLKVIVLLLMITNILIIIPESTMVCHCATTC